jgi:hypothetical protein
MLRYPRLSPLVVMNVIVLSGILTACASPTRTAVTDTTIHTEVKAVETPVNAACTAFPRLTFSRLHDTPETIVQVKAYNATRDEVCGKGK